MGRVNVLPPLPAPVTPVLLSHCPRAPLSLARPRCSAPRTTRHTCDEFVQPQPPRGGGKVFGGGWCESTGTP